MKGTLLVTAMRNEGPFIVEWIAWQKMLGFENILVMFNDCTDHSPQLLRQLQRHGVLTMKRHTPDPGEGPQLSAFRAARSHPLVHRADWMFICDVDEFLVIHKGDGTLSDLLPAGAPDFAGMAIHWLIFGDAGRETWEDGLVHQKFQRAATEKTKQNSCFKSFVYQPTRFRRFGSHIPHNWQGDGVWNEGRNHWILSDGSRLARYNPDGAHQNGTVAKRITHKVAQVNHYILQEREKYALKQGTKCVVKLVDRYTDDFHRRFNHNTVRNPLALTYKDRFDVEYARLMAIPGIRRLHHLCCADFVAALCADQGRDPADDARYRHHAHLGATLPKHWTVRARRRGASPAVRGTG
ncbi:MAG TPA: glycosyltransferase family 2 protein [Aliiroseovarius sp.]|nr:glycosyltransferase family 2 protein [Aliiroseovarius sp.]